ncbi:MAG: VRR-NUC domain-containing protein [Armatimonadetes bacterium]|nr:VRR-NUC domain-containing protein [Armatimonadota bacterium]
MAKAVLPVREKEFLQAVRELAELQGWLCYHTWNSVHSPAGFPDLVLVRPPRLVFAELKVGRNRPTSAQQDWLHLLSACPQVEVYLWTPADWEQIERVLRR